MCLIVINIKCVINQILSFLPSFFDSPFSLFFIPFSPSLSLQLNSEKKNCNPKGKLNLLVRPIFQSSSNSCNTDGFGQDTSFVISLC